MLIPFGPRDGAGALPLALAISIFAGAGLAFAAPYRNDPPAWWPHERVHVVTVFVCAPKDESRIVPGMLIPKLVPTETFRAADISPVQQAQEVQRKKKSSRR